MSYYDDDKIELRFILAMIIFGLVAFYVLYFLYKLGT